MKRVAILSILVIVSWLSMRPVGGQIPPEGGTAAYAADLAARRAKTMAALGPDTVLVLWSAPARTYSADINYPYRQDSNLFYLTGVVDEDTILVLAPGASSAREVLFVQQSDPKRELWYGHVMTRREVTNVSGIQTVYAEHGTAAFQPFMDELLGHGPVRLALADALPDRNATTPVEDDDAAAHVRWARTMQSKYPSLTIVSAGAALKRQRELKTDYEQRVLTRGAAISAAAHVEGMRATRPGRWEYEVKAAIEFQFLSHGALSWGYPSIVGSGENATTLHYLAGTRQMQSGELLLVDAAGSYQGLTADITRTYPVSGRFSKQQRALYELVLQAQEAGIGAARPGVKPEAVTEAVRAVFRTGLRALGLVRATTAPELDTEVNLWFPHLPIHGIGIDVHDPLGTLDPGAAFVIEPGLYIRTDAFERLPPTPENAALATSLASAVAEYRNLGIRIEDSFLMTPSGPVMLSAAAPRRVVDIERVVGHAR